VRLTLDYQGAYDWPAMLDFLAARAIDGLEVVRSGSYARSFCLHGLQGTFVISQAPGHGLAVELAYADSAALPQIVARLRRMFDLDADLPAIHRHLATDPLLAPLIARSPGLRVPGTWDGLELAMRAVLGQQISVAAAIRLAGKLVAQYGAPLVGSEPWLPGLRQVFPEAQVLASADLATLGMPRSRGRTLSGVAQALLENPGLFEAREHLPASVAPLLALWGVGDWTAQYIALRQMREADAFPPGDVGLLKALAALEGQPVSAQHLLARAESWRPYRGYAAQVLWTSLSRGD